MVCLGGNLYECDWCTQKIDWVKRFGGKRGKKCTPNQLECISCRRLVSQSSADKLKCNKHRPFRH